MKKWEKLKKFAYKFLFQAWYIVILFVILSIVGLLYAFVYPNANMVFSYFAYTISAYSLILVCVKIPIVIRWIQNKLYKNKYTAMYLTKREFRQYMSLRMGFCMNVCYAFLKLWLGVYYRSVWIITIGFYYIVISSMRFLIIRGEKKIQTYNNKMSERLYALKVYRFTGMLMFILNIAVTGLVILMIVENKSYTYPGFLIYASAAYAFYCFVVAVINMRRYRKLENPSLSAAKMLSFCCALMSILALQTAMISTFGSGSVFFARYMNSFTGTIVCAVIFGMAIYMVKKANKEMRQIAEL